MRTRRSILQLVGSGLAFAAFIKDDIAQWGKVVRDANIRIE